MDIQVIEEPGRREVEVRIVAAPGDPRVSKLVDTIRAASGKLVGYAPDGSASRQIIPLDQVACIETSEKRAYIRTVGGARFESPLKLFELEEALEGTEFVRTSRHTLVNFDKVVSIAPGINSRLELGLEGGQRVIVTRSYVSDIRRKLGAML